MIPKFKIHKSKCAWIVESDLPTLNDKLTISETTEIDKRSVCQNTEKKKKRLFVLSEWPILRKYHRLSINELNRFQQYFITRRIENNS